MSANPAPNAAIAPWSATARASSVTPAAARRGAVERNSSNFSYRERSAGGSVGRLLRSRIRRFVLSTSTVLAAGLGLAGVIGLPQALSKWESAWPIWALGVLAVGLLILRAWSEYRQQTYSPQWISSMFWKEFDNEGTREARKLAAKALKAYDGEKLRVALSEKDPDKNHPDLVNIDEALDFFEDLGFYVEGDQISPEVAHQAFYYWIEGYYLSARDYIMFRQKSSPTMWDHFRPLYEVASEVEASKVKDRKALDHKDLQKFLEGEIAL